MEWTSVALEEREQEAWWAHRRTQLKQHYETLPLDGQAGDKQEYLFWQRVEAEETPLEVLVRCVRACALPAQSSRQRRLIEVIIRRTQYENEAWARGVLSHLALHDDERRMLNADLCADLYEAIVRALLDQERRFWEEHFHHCLRYERQHIFRAFMMREGRGAGATAMSSVARVFHARSCQAWSARFSSIMARRRRSKSKMPAPNICCARSRPALCSAWYRCCLATCA